MGKKVRRLVEQFRPEHYELELVLDREALAFKGRVTITGHKVGRPAQRLTFHQKDLKITRAMITRHDKRGDESFTVERINTHASYDEVRLHSQQMLFPGSYSVVLEFKGTITRPMNGIYPCFFKHGGKEHSLLATQFESHHAREAFPCIDEPEAKATFQLSLVTPINDVVVSNTPIEKQVAKNRKHVTSFQKTPKMSTYLLAFVTGNLKSLEAKAKSGVVVRTYATPEHVAHTKFALDISVKILEFYNDYFGIDYPLPKCDLIALPDFASGAMENWGCITFREQALLVDPDNTSLPMKQYVAMVVAHELAHQWFGNLVTMRWWTDLWLNEGFASWIEYLAIDHLFPEWQMWTQFIVDEQEPALRLDALAHTHAIEVPINHPDEIRTIFDAISYGKGASIIHMLHQYLGAEDFRNGLHYYLKQHSFGNTDTVDLWAALEAKSQKPVKQFMHAWTSLPGFPIVAVKQATKLHLHQKRFHINPAADTAPHSWPVPLAANHELEPSLFDHATAIIDKAVPDDLRLNAERSGFYRVTYEPEHLKRLGEEVAAGKIPPLGRLGLLSDATEATKAGYTSTLELLKLLEFYRAETSSVVWDIIAGLLGSIRGVMDDEPLREAMKPYLRELTAEELKRLGWSVKKGEAYFDSLLRPTILGLSSLADEPRVIAKAQKRFKAAQRSEDIEPDLRGVIYGTVARTGGHAEFAKLLKFHNHSLNSEERVTLAAALSSFHQPSLIERALALIDSEDVRLQDVAYWIVYCFGNRFAKEQTWHWLTKHWDWLEANLGNDLAFPQLPLLAARAFSSDKFLTMFRAFFAAHNGPTLERGIKQGIETLEWQIAWRERDLEALKEYFKA